MGTRALAPSLPRRCHQGNCAATQAPPPPVPGLEGGAGSKGVGRIAEVGGFGVRSSQGPDPKHIGPIPGHLSSSGHGEKLKNPSPRGLLRCLRWPRGSGRVDLSP